MVLIVGGTAPRRGATPSSALATALRGAGLGTLELPSGGDHGPGSVSPVDPMADRVIRALESAESECPGLPIGCLGLGEGAAVALAAAGREPARIRALVAVGLRPELVWEVLPRIEAPTLLVLRARNRELCRRSEAALCRLHCIHRLVVVPSPGVQPQAGRSLDEIARWARSWFVEHLAVSRRWRPRPPPIHPVRPEP